MRLFELFEAKAKADKVVVKTAKPRNFVAKAVTRKTGAGPHSSKDKKLKRDEKRLADE